MTHVDDLYEPNDREPSEPDDENDTGRTTPVTAADIAEHLTGSDNDYTEALDGWPSIHAEGSVLYVKFTPAKATAIGSDADDDNARHFVAHVVELTAPKQS